MQFDHWNTWQGQKHKAWYSLANKHKQKHNYKHKHKDKLRTRKMAYLTQFSILAFFNPMINKMADEDDGLCLCLWLCGPRSH